jgi:UDP-sulfoquinovose synthase
MKIFVLGGDGFCGWPTSLHLSECGHEVTIIDNFSRRKIDVELEVESLTPIYPMSTRLKAWNEVSGKRIAFHNIDVAKDYDMFLQLINENKPDAIIHFAEQRAAPYSMKGSKEKRYTVNNNLNATNNVLCAIVESSLDIHLVHLGTMGVYGYSTAGMKIPEGYLKVMIEGDDGDIHHKEILHPPHPGSVYHLTKTQDALSFQYFNSNDGIRITDLHQGIVWGTNTNETSKDERLINRFDYDGDYGTVLNRFLIQSAASYPLTVHGSGGQTRAFIHIKDMTKCIEIAINNPPKSGENVQIFNQMTETHKVIDLANLIAGITDSEIVNLPNPRKEDDTNTLNVVNDSFLSLGLKPTTLENGLLDEIYEVARKYIDRCDFSKIICKSFWTDIQKHKSLESDAFKSTNKIIKA